MGMDIDKELDTNMDMEMGINVGKDIGAGMDGTKSIVGPLNQAINTRKFGIRHASTS
jgi:hypothetical protein